MNRKTWKRIKRSGGTKRKVLREYLNITSCSDSQNVFDIQHNEDINNETGGSSVCLGQALVQNNRQGSVGLNFIDGQNEPSFNIIDCREFTSQCSSTDDEEHYTDFKKNVIFQNKITKWAIERNITHIALKELSEILNERFPDILPNDPRTIVRTPRQVHIKSIEKGEYWHNGISESLIKIFENSDYVPEKIQLNINMDGLPIFNSSKHEFWPILCSVFGIIHQPFVVGIYFGIGKPKNLTSYLEDFVTEMQVLLTEGIKIKQKDIMVEIRCFICDSPARAYVKAVCNFNGKHGCLKCTTVGEYSHNSHTVVFPDARCPDRTDDHFRKKLYGLHHKADSPLLQLPIDMVQDFPVADSLHLIDLGVMKRLLVGWRDGNFGKYITKWSSRDIEAVSLFLSKSVMPEEIHRSMRSLDHLAHWKASEYRTFFYYLSIIILPHVLKAEAFLHFLSLFCGITICSTKKYQNLLLIAKDLLLYFVEHYKDYYGADYVTSNVHNIVHVVDEVQRFGPLQTFNAYPFENKLYLIKRMLRAGKNPLAQAAKRISEQAKVNEAVTSYKENTKCGYKITGTKTTEIQFKGFKLSSKTGDKYLMTTTNEIIEIKQILNENHKVTLKGFKITGLENVFEYPIKSSFFNIFKSKLPSETRTLMILSPEDVKFKLVCNEYRNELYFVPLLHTLD